MEVSLGDIAPKLKGVYAKLNPTFLRRLLIGVSNSSRPNWNKEFVEGLGYKFSDPYSNLIYGWLKGYKFIEVEKLVQIVKISSFSWKDVEENLVLLKGFGPAKLPNIFPIKVGRELGSIIGHILGDGSISKDLQTLFFSNSNPELLKEFESHMFKTFGIKPRIWMQEESNYGKTTWDRRLNSIDEHIPKRNIGLFYPKICVRILKSILGNFADGKSKNITKQLFCQNLEFKCGLIRAFIDDEGSVISRSIRVFQNDPKILVGIKKLLKEINIESGPILTYVKRDKNRHYFNICGYYNEALFLDAVGFTSSYKRERVQKFLVDIKSQKLFRFKVGKTKSLILNLLGENSKTVAEISFLLKKKFPDFKWHRSTVLTHLQDLENEGVVSKDRIKNKFLWSIFNNHALKAEGQILLRKHPVQLGFLA